MGSSGRCVVKGFALGGVDVGQRQIDGQSDEGSTTISASCPLLVVWSLMSLAPSILSSGAWVAGALAGSLLGLLLFNADGARLDANGETRVLP